MQHKFCYRGASGSGAPFAFRELLLTVAIATASVHSAMAADCAASHIDERAQVVYVYDGDTIKLKDGRRVRLIGINTPEIGRNSATPRPFAREARNALQELLDAGNRKVLLQYGAERQDHYGRLLAHTFLENGKNIAVHLLQQGLATTLVVPPNSWARDCYQGHEYQARSTGRGLWRLEQYQTQDARKLSPETRGFRLVHGRVSEIRQSRHNVWVDIDGPLVVRIPRKDLVNFEPDYLEHLAGADVETRGWVKQDRDGLRLTARHPAALTVIPRTPDQ